MSSTGFFNFDIKNPLQHLIDNGLADAKLDDNAPADPKTLWSSMKFTGGGTGDVVGPAAAGDSDIALYDGTTGKLIKDSGIVIDDSAPAGPNVIWTSAMITPGTGDVVGPAAAGDSNVPLYDGTTGKLIKDSGIVIDDSAPAGPTVLWTSAMITPGTGDVVGPASAVDGDLAIYDGTTGKLIKDTGLSVQDVFPDSTSILWTSAQIWAINKKAFMKWRTTGTLNDQLFPAATSNVPFILPVPSTGVFPTSLTADIAIDGSNTIVTLTATTVQDVAFMIFFLGVGVQNDTNTANDGRLDFRIFNLTTATQLGSQHGAYSYGGINSPTTGICQHHIIIPGGTSQDIQIQGSNPSATQDMITHNIVGKGDSMLEVHQFW